MKALLYIAILVAGAWITGCEGPLVDKADCRAKCAPHIMDYFRTAEHNQCVCDLTKGVP